MQTIYSGHLKIKIKVHNSNSGLRCHNKPLLMFRVLFFIGATRNVSKHQSLKLYVCIIMAMFAIYQYGWWRCVLKSKHRFNRFSGYNEYFILELAVYLRKAVVQEHLHTTSLPLVFYFSCNCFVLIIYNLSPLTIFFFN